VKRLLTEKDVTTFGMARSQEDHIRKYFTHTQVFVLPKTSQEYEAEFGYEVDTR